MLQLMRECKECGEFFYPQKNDSEFCSKKCRDKDYNRRYYLEHKEEKKIRDRKRYERIRQPIIAARQKYYEEHK